MSSGDLHPYSSYDSGAVAGAGSNDGDLHDEARLPVPSIAKIA